MVVLELLATGCAPRRLAALDTYRITLTAEGRAGLERLVAAGNAAARQRTPARILPLADERHGEGHADAEVVAALGTGLRTIGRLRQRFVRRGQAARVDHDDATPPG